MRCRSPAPTTVVDQNDHAAAAAYLMKHHGATTVVVLDGERSNRPMGILTETDIARAEADGKNLNTVRVHELLPHPPSAPVPAGEDWSRCEVVEAVCFGGDEQGEDGLAEDAAGAHRQGVEDSAG